MSSTASEPAPVTYDDYRAGRATLDQWLDSMAAERRQSEHAGPPTALYLALAWVNGITVGISGCIIAISLTR